MTAEEYDRGIGRLNRERNTKIAAVATPGNHPYEGVGLDRVRRIDREQAAELEILFWEAARSGHPDKQWAVDQVGGLDRIPSPETIRARIDA